MEVFVNGKIRCWIFQQAMIDYQRVPLNPCVFPVILPPNEVVILWLSPLDKPIGWDISASVCSSRWYVIYHQNEGISVPFPHAFPTFLTWNNLPLDPSSICGFTALSFHDHCTALNHLIRVGWLAQAFDHVKMSCSASGYGPMCSTRIPCGHSMPCGMKFEDTSEVINSNNRTLRSREYPWIREWRLIST
jgi:hypothetical protein